MVEFAKKQKNKKTKKTKIKVNSINVIFKKNERIVKLRLNNNEKYSEFLKCNETNNSKQ